MNITWELTSITSRFCVFNQYFPWKFDAYQINYFLKNAIQTYKFYLILMEHTAHWMDWKLREVQLITIKLKQ